MPVALTCLIPHLTVFHLFSSEEISMFIYGLCSLFLCSSKISLWNKQINHIQSPQNFNKNIKQEKTSKKANQKSQNSLTPIVKYRCLRNQEATLLCWMWCLWTQRRTGYGCESQRQTWLQLPRDRGVWDTKRREQNKNQECSLEFQESRLQLLQSSAWDHIPWDSSLERKKPRRKSSPSSRKAYPDE